MCVLYIILTWLPICVMRWIFVWYVCNYICMYIIIFNSLNTCTHYLFYTLSIRHYYNILYLCQRLSGRKRSSAIRSPLYVFVFICLCVYFWCTIKNIIIIINIILDITQCQQFEHIHLEKVGNFSTTSLNMKTCPRTRHQWGCLEVSRTSRTIAGTDNYPGKYPSVYGFDHPVSRSPWRQRIVICCPIYTLRKSRSCSAPGPSGAMYELPSRKPLSSQSRRPTVPKVPTHVPEKQVRDRANEKELFCTANTLHDILSELQPNIKLTNIS